LAALVVAGVAECELAEEAGMEAVERRGWQCHGGVLVPREARVY
jgi:hypothetical protein